MLHPTRTHLDGTWTQGNINLTVRRDINYGEYEVLPSTGVHLRFFSVDANNALVSEEYMHAGQYSDGADDFQVS